MIEKKVKGFEKEYENLKKCNIEGGTWIDAGSGQGAYTIPLAVLVSDVIAIDKNKKSLKTLEERVEKLGIENIIIKFGDIQDQRIYQEKNIKGVLFAFSLHYQNNIEFIREILDEKKEEKEFRIVIIEYTRKTPVFWVPQPCPPEKVLQAVQEKNYYKIKQRFRNDRYYILEIRKN